MEKRPDWVTEMAGKLDGVPELRRKEVVKLCNRVHKTALARHKKQTAERKAAAKRLSRNAARNPAAVTQAAGDGAPRSR